MSIGYWSLFRLHRVIECHFQRSTRQALSLIEGHQPLWLSDKVYTMTLFPPVLYRTSNLLSFGWVEYQIRSDQIRSDQIRSDQIRSDQIRSDQGVQDKVAEPMKSRFLHRELEIPPCFDKIWVSIWWRVTVPRKRPNVTVIHWQIKGR